MATHGGAADSYYNESNNQAPMQYAQQPQYQQPPPNYDQNNLKATTGPQMEAGAGGKQSWDQAFKLEKPKYNDLWAGILVCRNSKIAVFFSRGHIAIANHLPMRKFTFPFKSMEVIADVLILYIAHHYLPRLRRCLRPLHLRLQLQQILLRRRYLWLCQHLLPQHKHNRPLHLRPRGRSSNLLALLPRRTLFYKTIHLDHWHPQYRFCAGHSYLLWH